MGPSTEAPGPKEILPLPPLKINPKTTSPKETSKKSKNKAAFLAPFTGQNQ